MLIRLTAYVALAAGLALAACNSTTPSQQVAPAQGAIQFVHGNYQAATSRVNFTLDGVAGGDYGYGQGGGYLLFPSGLHTVAMTAGASMGTATLKLEPNVAYSYFAAPATSGSGLIAGRITTDDVTPHIGLTRIRLISLLANAGPDVELAQPATSGTYQRLAYDGDVFVDMASITTSLVLRDGSGQVLALVGSGLGTGVGAKKYEDSRVYTVLAVGDAAASNPNLRPRAYVLTNL